MNYPSQICQSSLKQECKKFVTFCIAASILSLSILAGVYYFMGLNKFLIAFTLVLQLVVECHSVFFDVKRNCNPYNLPVSNADFPDWVNKSEHFFINIKIISWLSMAVWLMDG